MSHRVRVPLYLIATVLFGIKTYIAYRFMFNITIDNWQQEFILLINPFISAFLFFTISVFIKKYSRQLKFIRYGMLFGTVVLYCNIVFYRAYTDFITIPQLFQMSNAGDLGSSVLAILRPYDFLFFIDVIIVWFISVKYKEQLVTDYEKKGKVFAASIALFMLMSNLTLSKMESPEIFKRLYNRETFVKNIGVFNHHIMDIIYFSKERTQRVFADGNDIQEIIQYVDQHVKSEEKSELFGIAEGRNIIFISAESIQNFVIKNDVNGQEITPFLNQLIHDKNTFYFDNFYHQTEQGKTSDSEFITENSLYPASRGAVFFTNANNVYHAMPEMLKEKGYQSYVFHANDKSFWNRENMYESLNFDHFYDIEAYEVTDENRVGWGLKDKPFFEQSMKYLKALEEPFYAKFITLTNHTPFELDEEDRSIDPYHSHSTILNNYFPTVRYMDESIEYFFELLKRHDLYENSIIVIMGDHDGISEFHNKALSMYLGKEEITPYDSAKLQRVPLFIHIPGYEEGRVISKIAGQIDMKPTILHLVGIETEQDIFFGNDLFQSDHKGYIAFRNGNFVSDDHVYTSGICYEADTGEVIALESEAKDGITPCTPTKRKVEQELEYSDEIIYSDLFRFVDFDW